MNRSIQLAAAMTLFASATVGAAELQDGKVALLFYRGQELKVVTYRAEVPKSAIGKLSCERELGKRVKGYEDTARKSNAELIGWTLRSVQCRAPNDNNVIVVQRVPVKQTAINGDEE